MKKFFFLTATIILILSVFCITASAKVTNNVVKVGLYFGSTSLHTANLDNKSNYGSGYQFGYYDANRNFHALGVTEVQPITMTSDGTIAYDGSYVVQDSTSGAASLLGGYHLQLPGSYSTYDSALAGAKQWGSNFSQSYVAFLSGTYRVRLGAYLTEDEAKKALQSMQTSNPGFQATVSAPSSTAVTVTKTKTNTILFQFDYNGIYSLGVQPKSVAGEKTITWFKNRTYYGGFEYKRVTGGNMIVINLVNLEDYLKCVIAYEMTASWPMEALKAQAVNSRTYACVQTKHDKSYGFDVCSVDCQTYHGTDRCAASTNAAVDSTAGIMVYYQGSLPFVNYFSSDGGATEDAVNVWGGNYPYLIGKEDPYEAKYASQIANYSWTVTFTTAELQSLMAKNTKTSALGPLKCFYVSQYTAMGNVYELTAEDVNGNVAKIQGCSACRTFLGLRSCRFQINGGAQRPFNVNGTQDIELDGVYLIGESGQATRFSGTDAALYAITDQGVQRLGSVTEDQDTYTITGTGWGHSVGMSQWGAYAMAKEGFTYQDILHFYFTDVTIA